VARAVVFLVALRALVFLDDIAVVLIEREASGNANLFVIATAQPIKVDTRVLFDDERGFLQALEILDGPFVYGVAVRVRSHWKLELSPRNPQETQRIVCGLRPRFLGRDNVVGDSRHTGGIGGSWPQRTKGTNGGHQGRIMSCPDREGRFRPSALE